MSYYLRITCLLEIMDILRVKKAHPPPMPTPARRRVTSAPIVPPEAQASDVAIEDTFPPPPITSSGFATLHTATFPVIGQPLEPPVGSVVAAIGANGSSGSGPSNAQGEESDDESSSESSDLEVNAALSAF